MVTLSIGYLAYPQILVISELSMALISCCLPGIFNILKFAARKYPSGVLKSSRPSESLEETGGLHSGAVGNPVDYTRHQGFLQLHDGRSDIDSSNGRVFDGKSERQHYTTAYPNRSTGKGNQHRPEEDISLNEIHVRNDFHIVGS